MTRKFLLLLSVLIGIIFLLSGCGDSREDQKELVSIAVPEDLNKPGFVIGVPQGAAAMNAGERFFDRAKIQYYNTTADGYTAVQQKKIDAFVFDRHNMEYVTKVNPAFFKRIKAGITLGAKDIFSRLST